MNNNFLSYEIFSEDDYALVYWIVVLRNLAVIQFLIISSTCGDIVSSEFMYCFIIINRLSG
jgi:hypothetical protein